MGKGSGLTRGDRRRNAWVGRLREVVGRDRAILAIDLGEDRQVAALMDHDGRVLGRRRPRAKAHALGALLAWAADEAAGHGFAGVVVGCEPTGHRWRSVMELADTAEMGFVCVQSLRVSLAREEDDYTRDKTDYKDTVLIGKLIARLECYLPERSDERWAQLRHQGRRRAQLAAETIACRQRIADLLACCWPAALSCAAQPLRSATWLACLAVTVDRCNGNPAKLRKRGLDRFTVAVRRELPRWGARKVCHRIIEAFYLALADPSGVVSQRRGALERVRWLLDDWRGATARQAQVEERMVAVLDDLDLIDLIASIPGMSALTAAMILAETGELTRFGSARAVVKHAGLNPVENTSATLRGRSRVSRRGRPALRAAAWRAAWGGLRGNPALRAKFTHLTTREKNRLTPGQARAACAAALLRWLYAIVAGRTAFDPALAGQHHQQPAALAA